jgi:citrate lyase subunit beta/citryl-CoA lyase
MKRFRSLLYAPADQPQLIEEAAASRADALILDLEDRVPLDRKAAAREIARSTVQGLGGDRVMYVRVNAVDSGMLGDDLDAIVVDGLEGIRVPKTDSAEGVREVDALLGEVERARGLPVGRIQLCLGLESALAVERAYDLCVASGRVSSIAVGLGRGGDLQTDAGFLPTPEGLETLYIRSKVLVAARAAGVPIPLDGGFGGYHTYDPATEGPAFLRSAELGRQLGYRAKITFHPAQVDQIHRIFGPTAWEVEESRRILAAADGSGAGPASPDRPPTSPSTPAVGHAPDEEAVGNARRILAWAAEHPESVAPGGGPHAGHR